MKSNWNEVKIDDICSIRRGASPRPIQKYISERGIPWVKIADATSSNSRFINETKEFIIEEGKEKSRYIEKGTLILSNSATPGLPKFMNINGCVHDGWLILDGFKGVYDNFLYYNLIENRIKLLSLSNGSVFRNLKTDIVKNFNIKLPPLEEQKSIAKILSDLDEKIEVNNKINKNLEEMAQTIFKQWFVDFEFPNEEGKPYKSSGGEMVESELGMIPKGWNISELGELYEVKGGKRLPKGHSLQDTKTKYPYIRVTDVANGSIDKKSLKYISEETREKIDKYNINYSDLYISIAGTVGIVGMINKSLDNASLTENMAKIKVGNIDKYYLYLLLNSKQGQETILSKVVGSTQPKLPLYAIKSIKILKGDNRINKKFYDYVNSLFMTRENNLDINERLEKLRNTLLPKLMSGEIRVPLENSED
ncbi:TPA: restriction endonuclease subunit S [Clostridium perfringens]